MKKPLILKIDLYILSFFQKLADKTYDWIRMPIKHLAFFSIAGAMVSDAWWYYLAYKVSNSFFLLSPLVCFDIIFYRIFWFGFKALEHRRICDKLHLHDLIIAWFRLWYLFFGAIKIISVILTHHINLSFYTTICLTAYLYFISCKQKPLKKHPLKDWLENVGKRFERKTLQPV